MSGSTHAVDITVNGVIGEALLCHALAVVSKYQRKPLLVERTKPVTEIEISGAAVFHVA